VLLADENQRAWGKTSPIATLFATDLTWIAVGFDPDLDSERPLTNCFLEVLALQNLTCDQNYGRDCPYSV